MENILINTFNVSLIAGLLVLGVALARRSLRKAPRILTCLLWAVVALRLVVPFSAYGPIDITADTGSTVSESRVQKAEQQDMPVNNLQVVIPGSIDVKTDEPTMTSDIDSDKTAIRNEGIANTSIYDVSAEATDDGEALVQRVIGYATVVWLVGMVCMILYALVGYIRLRLKTRACYEKEKGVWLCDYISTSFILGVIRPRIMIPSDIDPENEKYVLLHERAHLARFDHVWKLLAFILLSVYWYNPLIWVAFVLFSKDIEYACDERVVREGGEEIKKPYANALINCTAVRLSFAGPVAFGVESVADRVRNILNYKKPAIWVVAVVVLTAMVMTLCAMSAPVSGEDAFIYIEPTEASDTAPDTDSAEITDSTEPTENADSTEPSTEATEPESEVEAPEPTEASTESAEVTVNVTDPIEPEPEPVTEPTPTESEPVAESTPTEPEIVETEQPNYPSKIFNVLPRDNALEGEHMDLDITSFTDFSYFSGGCFQTCNAIIHNSVVDNSMLTLDISVSTSLDELRYNLHEINRYNSSFFKQLVDGYQFEKYTDDYFSDNALIVLIDSIGSGSFKHKIVNSVYKDGELSFTVEKLTKYDYLEGYTDDVTMWISLVEIPKSQLENISTISIYAERMEP